MSFGRCRVIWRSPVSRQRNDKGDPRVTLLRTSSRARLQASAWGCRTQDQSPAGSASQASLGFCSNDCLILRSFKHVKTGDSRAAHLLNDHLNYTTGIYHKYKGKGESLENQTWKISTLDQTAQLSAQGPATAALAH